MDSHATRFVHHVVDTVESAPCRTLCVDGRASLSRNGSAQSRLYSIHSRRTTAQTQVPFLEAPQVSMFSVTGFDPDRIMIQRTGSSLVFT